MSGWLKISKSAQYENECPNQRKEVLRRTRVYFNFRDELSEQDSMIFKGMRLIVPISMRSQMLDKIHSGHNRVKECLCLARKIAF